MNRIAIICLLLASAIFGVAGVKDDTTASSATPSAKQSPGTVEQEKSDARLEGEQRFRTNCGRCHQAPHKFPPRMMGTIVRHMRVRAMLTEEDMKFILAYMTE